MQNHSLEAARQAKAPPRNRVVHLAQVPLGPESPVRHRSARHDPRQTTIRAM
jgi:hypothetical protein